MTKKLFISLIFLLSLFSILLIPFQTLADSSITYIQHEEDLTPSYGEWTFMGRNGKQDFQNYTEGANPFMSTGGATIQQSVYQLNSTYLRNLIKVNTITNMGYEEEKCFLMYPPTTSSNVYTYFPLMDVGDNCSLLMFGMVITQVLNVSLWSGVDEYFYLRLEGVNYPILRLAPILNGSGYFQRVEYYNGGWITKTYFKYTQVDVQTYFVVEYVGVYVIAYTTLQYGAIISEIKNKTLYSTDYIVSGLLTAGFTGEKFTTASIAVRISSVRGLSMIINILTSNRFESFTENLVLLKQKLCRYVEKTYLAYSASQLFTVTIPPSTIYQLTSHISNIAIKSQMPIVNFSFFYCRVLGCGNEEIFTNINAYTTISINLYVNANNNSNTLTFNILYRTLTPNSFNNTIYIRITRIYTPYVPTFMDMLLTVIPVLLMLIIPSGIAAIKFKRNGFLLVFFIMTLILTSLSLIPLFVGLLIMGILAVIFLKLMQQSREEVE